MESEDDFWEKLGDIVSFSKNYHLALTKLI